MTKNDKKDDEERKPDLAGPDQAEVEQRVKKMLDLTEPEPKKEEKPQPKPEAEVKTKQPISITVSSAPDLPVDEIEATEEVEDEPEVKIINIDEAPKDDAIESIEDADADTSEELETKEDEEQVPTAPEPVVETKIEPNKEDEPEVKPEPEDTKLPEKEPEIKIDEKVLEDPKTAKAVDAVIARESDELLEADDEKLAKAFVTDDNKGLFKKIGHLFKAWWNNPKARWGTIITLVTLISLSFLIPKSRYIVLNTVGVRANATVIVLDESTGQPLKNVQVQIGEVSSKTDSNGTAQLSSVKLGDNTLEVQKRAFAPSTKAVTVRLGGNSFGDFKLKPTGIQYSFVVTDYLSGKPIEKVEAANGEATALSDSQGKIKLTLDSSDDDVPFEVRFVKEDFREDKITVSNQENAEQGVVMVAGRKHVFVSKKSGKYDVYSIDIDAKNQKVILAGTGSEKEDIALVSHPTNGVSALVSTREDKKNDDGFPLSTLTVIDLESEKSEAVTTSERIQMIDWIDDKLIYVQAVSGASASNPKRHRLMSYDQKTKVNKEIATSNYFNDVIVAGGKIYYAPSSAFQEGGGAQLYRVEPDGSGQSTILAQEVWNIFRTDYENLALSAQKDWFNLRIGEDKATALSSQPTNLKSRIYSDNIDKKSSLWVDERDGKGVLLNYIVETKDEQVLKSASGLKNPVSWLNKKDIIYRVSNDQETADYVLSIDGGEPKKIIDVTNTNSIDQWYYY